MEGKKWGWKQKLLLPQTVNLSVCQGSSATSLMKCKYNTINALKRKEKNEWKVFITRSEPAASKCSTSVHLCTHLNFLHPNWFPLKPSFSRFPKGNSLLCVLCVQAHLPPERRRNKFLYYTSLYVCNNRVLPEEGRNLPFCLTYDQQGTIPIVGRRMKKMLLFHILTMLTSCQHFSNISFIFLYHH